MLYCTKRYSQRDVSSVRSLRLCRRERRFDGRLPPRKEKVGEIAEPRANVQHGRRHLTTQRQRRSSNWEQRSPGEISDAEREASSYDSLAFCERYDSTGMIGNFVPPCGPITMGVTVKNM